MGSDHCPSGSGLTSDIAGARWKSRLKGAAGEPVRARNAPLIPGTYSDGGWKVLVSRAMRVPSPDEALTRKAEEYLGFRQQKSRIE
jgi:hypothetical protein